MLSTLLIAGSLSVDAFGVGCAYGLKQIKIPVLSRLLISLLSFGFALLSLMIAKLLNMLLPDTIGTYISVFILLFLGLYMIISGVAAWHCGTKNENDPHAIGKPILEAEPKIWNIGIRSLGLSIMIIRDPQCADLNHSKSIDLVEAFYVGLALSLDAIGACVGFGISATGIVLLPIAAGVFQYLCLSAGLFCGSYLKKRALINEKILSVIPGVIMIGIAVVRLMG